MDFQIGSVECADAHKLRVGSGSAGRVPVQQGIQVFGRSGQRLPIGTEGGERVLGPTWRCGQGPDDGWLVAGTPAAAPPEEECPQACGDKPRYEGDPPEPAVFLGCGTGQPTADAPPQFGRYVGGLKGPQFRFERVRCLVHGIGSSASRSRSLASA